MEYFYAMRDIGSRVNLDDRSLIEYFIKGVPDDRLNKAILFQSKSIRELKSYEIMRVTMQTVKVEKKPLRRKVE